MITFQYVANISQNEITYLGEAESKDRKKIIYEFVVQFRTTHTHGTTDTHDEGVL